MKSNEAYIKCPGCGKVIEAKEVCQSVRCRHNRGERITKKKLSTCNKKK